MAANLHLESFLEMMSVERNASKNTLESYERDISDFLEGIKAPPESCCAQDVKQYIESLHGLKARSRARKLSSLRQFFNYLYNEKNRSDNPVNDIDAPKLEKSLPKFLSENEVKKLLDGAAQDVRLKAMLEILYASGLRVSELIALKQNSARQNGDNHFMIIKGKGSKERLVPLNSHAIAAIENQKSKIKNQKSEWLFPSGKSHITRQRFGQLLKELAVSSGIDPVKVSPHVLRHSFASHILAGGADLRLVQELLGHEQIATTQIYTHIQSTKLQAVVEQHHPLAKK